MTIPRGLLPPRRPDTHKGDVGRVLILAGSPGLTGAAALCSLGALRAGAGLVTLGIPASLQDLMALKLTEIMTHAFAQTRARTLSLRALPALLKAIDQSDVLAIGPGLSQESQTQRLVARLLPRVRKPSVIDADALNALANHRRALSQLPPRMILTPHPGEMARLLRASSESIQRNRERVARTFAREYGVTLVLKGFRTIVADPRGAIYMNNTGNPGMASGGSGDVLTGVIAGLLGQSLSTFDAARLGVYLHGLAGDLAAAQRGQVGLIAGDLLATIPAAIRQYQQGSRARNRSGSQRRK